jgi:ribose 5-phosphate isomerase B
MPDKPTQNDFGGHMHIGSDHAGFKLKADLLEYLRGLSGNFSIEDCGTYSPESFDYPEAARAVCRAVLASSGTGVLICGSGIGVSMSANRMPGIRAALCTHEFHARVSRAHNNANVICFGERVTAAPLARELLKIFMETPFDGGRHARRIELMETREARINWGSAPNPAGGNDSPRTPSFI